MLDTKLPRDSTGCYNYIAGYPIYVESTVCCKYTADYPEKITRDNCKAVARASGETLSFTSAPILVPNSVEVNVANPTCEPLRRQHADAPAEDDYLGRLNGAVRNGICPKVVQTDK